MTNMYQADRVLEVGCGPGKHSLMIASNFLKNGGVLVSSDFSKNMIQRLGINFTDDNNEFGFV